MLEAGQLKGDKGGKGDTGNGLEFNWIGTELGVKVEGQTEYEYVDLKGETGSIDNLDKSHITNRRVYFYFAKYDLICMNLLMKITRIIKFYIEYKLIYK